jgi:hypothetical protein
MSGILDLFKPENGDDEGGNGGSSIGGILPELLSELTVVSGEISIPFRLLPNGAKFKIDGFAGKRLLDVSPVAVAELVSLVPEDLNLNTVVQAKVSSTDDCAILIGGVVGLSASTVKAFCDKFHDCPLAYDVEGIRDLYVGELVTDAAAGIAYVMRERLLGNDLSFDDVPFKESILSRAEAVEVADGILSA